MDVLDLQRALKGQSFLGLAVVAPVAAEYSSAQLWNPAASGKLLLVRSVLISLGTAGIVVVGYGQTEYGNGGSQANKYAGGAAGVGLVRWDQSATENHFETVSYGETFLQATVPTDWPFAEPIVIPPGYGLTVNSNVVNAELTATFEWDEVSG